MANSPETRIEIQLISQVSALSYISTNSISVRSSDDMEELKADAFVNVSCSKAERLDPTYYFYRTDVEITSTTHIPNDEDQTISESLYDAVNDWAQNLTAADVNTPLADPEITVDGIVPQTNDTEYDDNWRLKTLRFQLFYTFTQTT